MMAWRRDWYVISNAAAFTLSRSVVIDGRRILTRRKRVAGGPYLNLPQKLGAPGLDFQTWRVAQI